jgi:Tol biopolymer transport system component
MGPRPGPRWSRCAAMALLLVGCGGDGDGGGGTQPNGDVASVTVTPAVDTVFIRGSLQLTATATDAGGAAIPGAVFTWTSSDPALATVSASGAVSALATGTVTITAKAGSHTDHATLTLAPVVAIAPRLPSLFAGDTAQLVASLTDAIGAPLAGGVSWTSESPGIATVDQNGVVTGLSAGTARLTAVSNGGIGAVDAVVLPRSTRPTRALSLFEIGTRSFDGTSITELWTLAPDGSQRSRVSPFDEHVIQYAWSPDGSEFLLTFSPISLNGGPLLGLLGLYRMDATGENLTPLVTGDARGPAWAPDGEHLAYFTGRGDANGHTHIVSIDRNAGQVRKLTAGGAIDVNPVWSPDGRRIAWRRDGPYCLEIWTMDADGSHASKLPVPAGCTFAWSPDGKRITVDVYLGPNQPVGIWMVNSDGTGAHPFTPNCTAVPAPACTGPSATGAVWSPDGTKIAYVVEGLQGIVVAQADGSGSTIVEGPVICCAPPTRVVWSPDGQQLAFETTILGHPRLGVVAASDGPPTLISPQDEWDTTIEWQL